MLLQAPHRGDQGDSAAVDRRAEPGVRAAVVAELVREDRAHLVHGHGQQQRHADVHASLGRLQAEVPGVLADGGVDVRDDADLVRRLGLNPLRDVVDSAPQLRLLLSGDGDAVLVARTAPGHHDQCPDQRHCDQRDGDAGLYPLTVAADDEADVYDDGQDNDEADQEVETSE